MKTIKFSSSAKKLKLGKYEHYKKKYYQVLGVAIHSETLEELVVYKALYGDKLTWVRPFDMFTETVKIGGVKVLRFKFVGRNI